MISMLKLFIAVIMAQGSDSFCQDRSIRTTRAGRRVWGSPTLSRLGLSAFPVPVFFKVVVASAV